MSSGMLIPSPHFDWEVKIDNFDICQHFFKHMKQIFENCQENSNFTISRPYKRPYDGFFGFLEHFKAFSKYSSPKNEKFCISRLHKRSLKGLWQISYWFCPKKDQKSAILKHSWWIFKRCLEAEIMAFKVYSQKMVFLTFFEGKFIK